MTELSERYDKPGFKYRCHKWAMCAHKGGVCIGCKERVTQGNISEFQFHHKTQVNNRNDKTDRWGGGIRDWPPFTEKWFAWADGVDLICTKCHQEKHQPIENQLSLNIEVQARLDHHEHGPLMMLQSEFGIF